MDKGRVKRKLNQLVCTFSILIPPTYFKFTAQTRTLSKREPCQNRAIFAGKFMILWQRLWKRRDSKLTKNPFSSRFV